jgi:hypothetical protein
MGDGNPCSCISMHGDSTTRFIYLLPYEEEKG